MADLSYIPPEVTSILGVVDTHLRWKQTQQHRNYKHYHPSEMGKCLRKAQYSRYVEFGWIDLVKKDMDSQKLRLFDKGHNMHARWQKYFTDIGILRGVWRCRGCGEMHGEDSSFGDFRPNNCDCGRDDFKYNENSVYDEELNIRGNCDLVLDFSRLKSNEKLFEGVRKAFNLDHLPDSPIVIDMKTINYDQFKRQVIGKGPHPEYIMQLTIYIHLLGCEYGLIIYENKNNSDIAAFKVEKNDERFNIIKEQLQAMNAMVKDKFLPPPRPTSKSDYNCKFCDFAPHCHKSKVWNDPKLEEKRKRFYKELL